MPVAGTSLPPSGTNLNRTRRSSFCAERVNEPDREGILVVLKCARVLHKERDVGIVVPVLEAGDDTVLVFEFAGDGDFFHLLRRSAREAMFVVVILPARR